jgi:trehalose utilization protein
VMIVAIIQLARHLFTEGLELQTYVLDKSIPVTCPSLTLSWYSGAVVTNHGIQFREGEGEVPREGEGEVPREGEREKSFHEQWQR